MAIRQLTNLQYPMPLGPDVAAPVLFGGFGAAAGGTFSGANGMRGSRFIAPKSGVLTDLAICVTVQSGNIELSIWDDSATTRNALYRSGSIACPAAATTAFNIAVAGSTGVTVRKGQHFDMALGCDNTTAAFARHTPVISQLPAGYLPSPNGAAPWLGWLRAASFTAPTSFLESSLSSTTNCPLILARIV